jgi:hypothetical protein
MEQQDRLHSLDAVRARQRSTNDRMASRCALSAAEGFMRLDTKRVAVNGKPSHSYYFECAN